MNIERKKRIAIITPYGGESRLDNYAEFNLAQGLIAKGWEVRMYTYAARGIPGYVNDLNYKGIPVYRTRYRLGVSPRLLLLLLGFFFCFGRFFFCQFIPCSIIIISFRCHFL